jgi:hypothetical protein
MVVEQLVSIDVRVDFTECELQKTRSASTRGLARYHRTSIQKQVYQVYAQAMHADYVQE